MKRAPAPRATATTLAGALVAGLCTLALAVGISRFAYTPILPVMQADLGLSNAGAGWLASMNYVGYLLGALGAGFIAHGRARELAFRVSLATVLLGTLLMARDAGMAGWSVLRLTSGMASGVLFVLAADRVMRVLAAQHRPDLVGVHFSGVAVGIVISGLCAPVLASLGGWQAQWIGLGLVSAVLMLAPLRWLSEAQMPVPVPAVAELGTHAPRPRAAALVPLWLLLVVYTLDGFGYIISGTFLVTIVERSNTLALGSMAWVIVGLAGVPSCMLAAYAARRVGYVPALLCAHVLQALGVSLPAISNSMLAALGAAVLFGGTFMAITTLAIALGREIAGAAAARAIGVLTAGYGVGQIAGPLVAGPLADRSGDFVSSLWLATAALVLAAALLWWGARARVGGRA